MDPDRRVLTVARRQHGALSHAQARAAGLSDDQTWRRVRQGAWLRPVRGIYVLAGSPDSAAQRMWIAQLATAGAGGVLSFVTAAAVHRLLPFPPLPHVTVPADASGRCPVAQVHRGVVPLVDRAHRDWLVVTSASRTIVDLAMVLDRPALERVVDTAFCERLATVASTREASHRVGRRRGNDLLRTTIDVWSAVIEPDSPAEVRLLRGLGELGLTGLVTQYEVRDADGRFVARLDVAGWRAA